MMQIRSNSSTSRIFTWHPEHTPTSVMTALLYDAIRSNPNTSWTPILVPRTHPDFCDYGTPPRCFDQIRTRLEFSLGTQNTSPFLWWRPHAKSTKLKHLSNFHFVPRTHVDFCNDAPPPPRTRSKFDQIRTHPEFSFGTQNTSRFL